MGTMARGNHLAHWFHRYVTVDLTSIPHRSRPAHQRHPPHPRPGATSVISRPRASGHRQGQPVIEPTASEELHLLGTEQVRPELDTLDQMSVGDLVALMCHDVRQVPLPWQQPLTPSPPRCRAWWPNSNEAGDSSTSARAPRDVSACSTRAEAGPTFNVDEGQVVGVLAGGLNAFGVPVEGAEDDFIGGADAIHDLAVSAVDCVVGISASGRTPYVLGAVEAARLLGAVTVGLSCNVRTPLSAGVDLPIEVVVGPELIAGSTRMNSGTAQKLVLNIISTASMVRLGKTYGNLMVDVRPTNEKLRDRSRRIVSRITAASDDVVVSA